VGPRSITSPRTEPLTYGSRSSLQSAVRAFVPWPFGPFLAEQKSQALDPPLRYGRKSGSDPLSSAITVGQRRGERLAGKHPRGILMASIGYLTKQDDKTYTGVLTTLSINTKIRMVANGDKKTPKHPDFRILGPNNQEVGAGWKKISLEDKEYIRVSLESPEFGPRRLYANLGRAAGQDDPDTFAIIWNAED